MGRWWEDYAAKTGGRDLTYGERIKRNASSAKRASAMTGLPYPHAKALCKWLRKGVEPTLPHPDEYQPESPATVTPPVEREVDGEAEHPGIDYALKARYFHDAATDTYVTPLRDAPGGFVQLPGSVHREILRAYSSADGSAASVNAVAREFQMPRPWVKEYLRAHSMTHDQVPFAIEEMMVRDDADLLNDMRQMRIAAVHKKMERDKWRHLEEDAQRWREFEANIMAPLLAAFEHRKPVKIPRLELPACPGPPRSRAGR